jgi:hypothetical protein
MLFSPPLSLVCGRACWRYRLSRVNCAGVSRLASFLFSFISIVHNITMGECAVNCVLSGSHANSPLRVGEFCTRR